MTTQYAKGAWVERYVQHWLERNNYYVMRGAGSHGAFDLLVVPLVNTDKPCKFVGLNNHNVFGIQVKSLSFEDKPATFLDTFMWSKELQPFRLLEVGQYFNKYLFVFNSKSKKNTPYVFQFIDGNYQRIDIADYYDSRNLLDTKNVK